jgi:deoxyribonuclease V
MSYDDRNHVIGVGQPSLEEYENVKDENDAMQLESRVKDAILSQHSRFNEKNNNSFSLRFVLALDIGYSTNSNLNVAAGIIYDTIFNEIVVQKVLSQSISSFEYVPGLLAFREVPLLAKVAKCLLSDESYTNLAAENLHQTTANDIVLMCDGNGTLHPRLCGLACHLGILFGLPAFGVGKTYLIGAPKDFHNSSDEFAYSFTDQSHIKDPDKVDFHPLKSTLPSLRGSMIPLYVQNQLAGHMLRTQDNVNPLFVSSGIGISQIDAVKMTLALCTEYRQPEPIRIVDHLGRMEIRRLEKDK